MTWRWHALAGRINRLWRYVPAWPLYLLGAGYAGWLFWLGLSGGLGVDPVKELEWAYGKKGLQLLLITLAITPLARFTRINLIKYRRALGLLVFGAICLHLSVWLVLDVQLPNQIWADIIKRPYITIGMLAFVLMVPLAITSNHLSLRKLGKRWRSLHKLVYAIVLLGCLHFFLLVKGIQLQPLVYAAIAVLLLVLRVLPRRRR